MTKAWLTVVSLHTLRPRPVKGFRSDVRFFLTYSTKAGWALMVVCEQCGVKVPEVTLFSASCASDASTLKTQPFSFNVFALRSVLERLPLCRIRTGSWKWPVENTVIETWSCLLTYIDLILLLGQRIGMYVPSIHPMAFGKPAICKIRDRHSCWVKAKTCTVDKCNCSSMLV